MGVASVGPMNFLKALVALDVREARRGLSLEVERGLCFTASARIGFGFATRVPETQ